MAEGTSGVVLAGGASRRMGPVDKRSVSVDGRPLLAAAVDAVAAVCDEVLITAGRHDPPPTIAGARVVYDRDADGGPLAGIESGLRAAGGSLVVVLAGDHPAAAPAVLADLLARLTADEDLDAVVLGTDHGPQPLVGAYRRSAAPVVTRLLDRGERRARVLLDVLRVEVVGAAAWHDLDPRGETAVDLDTPADLAAWRARPASAPRRPPAAAPTTARRVTIVRDGTAVDADDVLAGEEPLQIRAAGPGQDPVDVAVTLRTPGHEADLAVGFLHAEGLLAPGEVAGVEHGDPLTLARPDDTVTVRLTRPLDVAAIAARRTAATAACGVCGKASIEDVEVRCPPLVDDGRRAAWSVLAGLPDRLRDHQEVFAATGGLHAAATANLDGDLEVVREDVGRHNALDAVVGAHLLAGELPLVGRVLVLSGRIGFELVQKAALAGIALVVAVGAASDLAVRTAEALGLTLVGFLRDGDATIYCGGHRIDLDA